MTMKSGVSGAMRRAVFRDGGYRCANCGVSGTEVRFPKGGFGYPTTIKGLFLSIDHIVARANGGTSERSNLRVLCTICNSKKGTRAA